MEAAFKIILMTSLYASVAGIIILALKRMIKNKISPRWQYFIWFILIFKLIMPFGPESVVSIFNVAPKVPQDVSFEQTYNEYHKTITFMKRQQSNISTAYKVKEQSLHLSAIIETKAPYIWILGFIIMLLWLAYNNYSLHKKLKKNNITVPKEINKIFECCKKRVDINRNIKILVQTTISTPAIFGVFKPKILLSPEIINLDDKQISYIFLHELTHYKRKDLLVNYILLMLQAIHWFNPIIWYCFKTIRQDMEAATDEMVLRILEGEEQKEYAKALLAVLESFNSLSLAPKLIGMVNDKKDMERRIKMIKRNAFFKSRKKIIIITGILCIAILSMGLLTNAVTEGAGKTAAIGISKMDGATKKSNMTIVANPAGYSSYQSMYPGIGITIKYKGKADKVRYSTNYGSLETWDRGGTWKVKGYGNKVELPINMPVYWSALGNGKTTNIPSAKKITINVSVLNKKQVLEQKELIVVHTNSDAYQLDKASITTAKVFEAVPIKVTKINQVVKEIKKDKKTAELDYKSLKEPPKLKIIIGNKEMSY
jgi:bla regulator protein BlaR1